MEIDLHFESASDGSGVMSPCRIAEGWLNAGREGRYIFQLLVDNRWWSAVLWHGEYTPDFIDSDAIEIFKSDWIKVPFP